MFGHRIPNLNARFLPCQCHLRSLVFDNCLVLVAFLDEQHCLGADHQQEQFVENSEPGKAEEKGHVTEQNAHFDQLEFVSLFPCLLPINQRQPPKRLAR